VLNRVKKHLGLDRVEKLYFGAAPLSDKVKRFFAALNMPLINTYGLSETAGGATHMDQGSISITTAGRPYPGTQIKVFNPDEQGVGEVCVRGRNVFMGYLDNDADTIDSFDPEGFFHTGDLGCLDRRGFLEITGRIKELIITAGGENVSPLPIETQIKEACPIVRQAVVIGDERKYLTCLLTLKVTPDAHSGKPTNDLSPEVQGILQAFYSKSKTVPEARTDPQVAAFIQKCVDAVNEKAVSRVN